jgi:hypothetical protein
MDRQCSVWLGAALLISAVAVSSPAMASNIVLNPGFETDALAPWVGNPSSNEPWVVTGPSVFAHTGQFYASTGCVGAQCMTPDPDPSGAWLYQDLATTPGTIYNLSFWYFPSAVPNDLAVLWNGVQVLDLLNSGPGDTFNFFSVQGLLATGATTRLEFLGQQAGQSFNGLDDVCVDRPGGDCDGAAVPEPTSLVLIGSGLVGLFGQRRLVRDRTS